MTKLGGVKVKQRTRPSIVAQNYSAKLDISDLTGINVTGVNEGDILVYNANTGNFEARASDLSGSNSSFNQANLAFNQANLAIIKAETPSHVANSASIYANGAFVVANSLVPFSQAAFLYANGTAAHSNAVNNTQNTNIQFNWNHSNSAFTHANAGFNLANTISLNVGQTPNLAFNQANAAFNQANSANILAQAAFNTANNANTRTIINGLGNSKLDFNTYGANSAYLTTTSDDSTALFMGTATAELYAYTNIQIRANTGGTSKTWTFGEDGTLTFSDSTIQNTAFTGSAIDQVARNTANAAFLVANTADAKGTSAGIYANGAFAAANSAGNYANGAFAVANSASIYANGAFAAANNEAGVNITQNTNITTAQNLATAAFIRANNSINANNGGTITGDLSISGNLSVLGNTFTVSATTIVANDTVILLGAGNYTSDLLDIGISAHYNDGVNAHTGIIRDHGTKEWQLFEGYTGEIGANNDININDPSFKKATLNANLKSQSITLNNQNLQTYIDGAYNTANESFNAANSINGVNITQNNSIAAAFTQANSVYLPSVTRLDVTHSGSSAFLFDQYSGNNPTIFIRAGETIAFNLNVTGHPFLIRVSNGGAQYDTGLTHVSGTGTVVTGSSAQGQVSGTLYWKVPAELAGSTYVYQCQFHCGMVGSIIIENLNQANAAFITANAAFERANNSLNANTGGEISGNLIPTTDNTYYLGSETKRWHTLYVGNGSIDLGGLILSNQNGMLAVANAVGQTPMPIAGSDDYARNHANGAFIAANTADTKATSAGVYANGAFLAANSITGIDVTQNNRITYASNHANSAFATANDKASVVYSTSAFNHANSSFNAANSASVYANGSFATANNAVRNSYDVHGKFKISADASGRYIMPSSHPNQTNPGIYVEAGKTYAFELNIPYADSGLTLKLNNRFGANVGNLTHISTSGVITTNSTLDQITGTLYWTVPSNVIGNTFAYCNSTFNQLSGRIEIINPALYQNTSDLANSTTLRTNSSFDHANSSFNHANAAFLAANSAGGADTYARNHANAAFIAANSAGNYANAAFLVANSAAAYSNTVNATQNTNITFAWNHANAAFLVANSAAAYSNTVNATQNTNITFAWNHANAAFNSANSGSADSVARQKANASTSLIYGVPFTAQELWGMGYNNNNLLGTADTASRSSPIQIFSTSSSTWKKLQENDENFSWGVGIKTDGSLWVWGFTLYVYPPAGFTTSTPVIVGTDYKWKTVAAAETSMYLIDNNNVLWGSGRNGRGQLGDNTTVNKTSPITIGSNTFTWSSIAPVVTGTGLDNGGCLAIRRDGTLWAWGEDVTGVLGLNDSGIGLGPYRSSPTQVGANNNWSFISVGYDSSQPEAFSAAITRDGYLYTWGKNSYGQLGSGNTLDRSSPTQVGSNSNWRHVSCSYRTTLAIKTDGTLWAWGDSTTSLVNVSGIHRSSPTQIGTSTDWKTVKITRWSAFGLKTNGTLWGWGTSQDGMLGQNLINGGSITSPSLLSFTSEYNTEIIDISPGQRTTYFIKGIT